MYEYLDFENIIAFSYTRYIYYKTNSFLGTVTKQFTPVKYHMDTRSSNFAKIRQIRAFSDCKSAQVFIKVIGHTMSTIKTRRGGGGRNARKNTNGIAAKIHLGCEMPVNRQKRRLLINFHVYTGHKGRAGKCAYWWAMGSRIYTSGRSQNKRVEISLTLILGN